MVFIIRPSGIEARASIGIRAGESHTPRTKSGGLHRCSLERMQANEEAAFRAALTLSYFVLLHIGWNLVHLP